jgi:hypothetical protein
MRKWFTAQTIEDLKIQYRELIKQYHPDVAGHDTTKEMASINAEYEQLFPLLKNKHNTNKQTDAEPNNNSQNHNVDDGFREVINSIIHCDGLNIEICGTWVSVSGNTFPHKYALKQSGFMWASKKKMWYWHSPDEIRSSHKSIDMETIREKYGSQAIKGQTKVCKLASN